MITVFAPAGIGEVGPDTDLAAEVVRTTATDESGPLRSGDILVVTSKVVSKVEARFLPADQRERAIDDESVRTVARRGPTRIVRTRHGLTVAAAGVDNSNVTPESILLLPVDPDASAARLRHRLQELTGLRLGVVISDTAGRAWRIGQTDQAIGSSGVRVIDRYEGRTDPYGNELRVTAVAVADELAGAADLVKSKLSGRPVAVVRGLSDQLADDGEPDEPRAADPPEADVAAAETRAAVLVRDESTDMFRFGSREAVIAAVLHATGQSARYEAVLAHPTEAELVDAVLRGSGRTGAEADLLRLVLEAAFAG